MLSTYESIALQQHLNQTSATLCDPANQGGSDEAFVLVNCNTPDPSLWRQGVNVGYINRCLESQIKGKVDSQRVPYIKS